MAYSKTNWVDNTTPIDKDNLNKIEQGIYDNSLVVDAVTDTLNPTDTETYKTAELTEGQITDVIGVNDILIKGQTEQDGEPTPSSPVDVNVVSGSNVINTSNKNILDLSKYSTQTVNGVKLEFENGAIICNGTATANVVVNLLESNLTLQQGAYALSGCPSGGGISSNYKLDIFKINTSTQLAYDIGNGTTFTLSEQTTFDRVRLVIFNGKTVSNLVFKPQLEKSSTATTYEPHQGKELPLDLPVENLLNISNDINTTTSGITVSLINTDTIDFNGVASNTYISTGTVNLTKPLESGKTYCFKAFGNNDSNLRFRIWGYNSNNELKFNVADGNSLTLNTDIIKYKLVLEWLTVNNKYNIQAKFQVSEAPYINTYTPYGTETIELCKIGDYQDYFYKSGSKWYLHKEIEKYKFTGDENWTKSGSNNDYYELVSSSISHISNAIGFCNRYKQTTILNGNLNTEVGISIYLSNNLVRIRPQDNLLTNITDFKNDLSSNETILYYPLKEKTDTEITDTTLISQLEAIYNAPLYEQTNITQTNNDLPMVLDITACKDNINGIKAFIRK